MKASAGAVIHRLGLQPHPEGGWFRETWRAPSAGGERSAMTAIHYLLQRNEQSHWHRIDASEAWLYQAGGALRLRTAVEGVTVERSLGPDIMGGELLHAIVGPNEWQAADTEADWVLVACIVTPGFEYSGLELAPPNWEPDPV